MILGQQMSHTQSEAEKNLKERIAQIETIRDVEPGDKPQSAHSSCRDSWRT
jgi:hypothetical protein